MGEAKIKNKRYNEMLLKEPQCIYCSNKSKTIDHMPPISMFNDRQRPKGFEFVCCSDCNQKTKSSEAVANYVAHLSPLYLNTTDPNFKIIERKVFAVIKNATPFHEELKKSQRFSIGGNLEEITIRGPIMSSYLAVFGAKLQMALYREILGKALPLNGFITSKCFCSALLNKTIFEQLEEHLPNSRLLQQGKRTSKGNFEVIYEINEENTTILSFSKIQNMYIYGIASTNKSIVLSCNELMQEQITQPEKYLDLLPN